MKLLIAGAGAIGALYGSMLQKAGARVSVLCRSGCKEILENGIQIKSIWGDGTLQVERAFRFDELPDESFDLILVATKVLPGTDLAGKIAPAVGKNTSILILQNGWNVELPYRDRYPHNEILSALAFVCSNRHDLLHIEHLDYGKLNLGIYRSGSVSRLKEVAGMLERTGVPLEISEQIQRDRWIKLIWNVPFNPLSVLGNRATTEEILSGDDSRNLAGELMNEILLIGRGLGFELESGLADLMMERTLKMKPYRTSMLLDYESGRPMEIEAILGEPLREARRLGISVPRMETIYALLRLLDRSHI